MTTYSAALPKYRGRKTFRSTRVYLGAGPVENRGWAKVLVAATVSFHKNVGTIIVRVTHGEYVSELHDVDASSIDTGDCLVRGSDGIWRGQSYKNWVSLTETEYAALSSYNANTLYLVKDDVSGLLSAIYVGSVLLFTAP